LSSSFSNLETDLLTEFHCFEKLKLQVKKQAEAKTSSQQAYLVQTTDFDPSLHNKLDAIKKLDAYMQQELTKLAKYRETKRRELRDKMNQNVPVHEIYEMIKAINLNVKYHNGQVNKIIEKLKFAKLGRTVFRGNLLKKNFTLVLK